MGLENGKLWNTPEITPEEKISRDTGIKKAELLKELAETTATGAYIDENGKLRFTWWKEEWKNNPEISSWDMMLIIRTEADVKTLMKTLRERWLTLEDLKKYPPNKWLGDTISISNWNVNYKWPKSWVDPIIWVPPAKGKAH